MNLVNNIFGTQLNDGVQLAIVFGTLLVLLLLVVWLARAVFGNKVTRMAKNRQPRLAVTDAAIVDDKRRLVLVRRDNVEHLLLIGGNSDVLVESNISRVTPVQVPVSMLPEKQQTTPIRPLSPVEAPISPPTAAPASKPALEPSSEKSGMGFAAKIGAATAVSAAGIGAAATKTANAATSLAEKSTDTAGAIIDSAATKVEHAVDKIAEAPVEEKAPEIDNQIDAGSEIDLEEALTLSLDDKATPADGDMEKILEELAAELK